MNVSSARNAVKQKNYDKAIQLLDKELEVNPSSEDALDLLYQVYDATNNIDKQVEVLNKLDQVAQSPKFKQLAPAYKTNLWVKCYQNTIKYYN